MSMLACARRRVQAVLPPFAFSTSTLQKQDPQNWNDLSKMLETTGDTVSPIVPAMNQSDPRWQSFRANRVINPADLTYQSRTYQPRRPKKTSVAPPSSTCRYHDPFYQLDLDPRSFTSNYVVLSEYLSEMGKIQGRAQTYLTAKNQRLLGKTIRRAKMMGIIPHLSIHPSVERSNRSKRR